MSSYQLAVNTQENQFQNHNSFVEKLYGIAAGQEEDPSSPLVAQDSPSSIHNTLVKQASFSVSHLLDLEELPRGTTMFSNTESLMNHHSNNNIHHHQQQQQHHSNNLHGHSNTAGSPSPNSCAVLGNNQGNNTNRNSTSHSNNKSHHSGSDCSSPENDRKTGNHFFFLIFRAKTRRP